MSSRVDTGPGTVARIASIMRALAEAPGDVTIKWMSDRVGLPPSTVHRLLHLLMEHGFIARANGQGYRVGDGLLRVATRLASRIDVRGMALSIMRDVVAQCGEGCVMLRYLPETRQIMTVAYVSSTHPLRYAIELFKPMTAAWGATGRSVVAFLPQAEIDGVYDLGDTSPCDQRAMPPRAEFDASLAAVREAGFAMSRGQRISGAVGIGVPLRSQSGRVIGSLCVTLPTQRYTRDMELNIAEVLRGASERLAPLINDDAWDAGIAL